MTFLKNIKDFNFIEFMYSLKVLLQIVPDGGFVFGSNNKIRWKYFSPLKENPARNIYFFTGSDDNFEYYPDFRSKSTPTRLVSAHIGTRLDHKRYKSAWGTDLVLSVYYLPEKEYFAISDQRRWAYIEKTNLPKQVYVKDLELFLKNNDFSRNVPYAKESILAALRILKIPTVAKP